MKVTSKSNSDSSGNTPASVPSKNVSERQQYTSNSNSNKKGSQEGLHFWKLQNYKPG
jgi:hypothetical protein